MPSDTLAQASFVSPVAGTKPASGDLRIDALRFEEGWVWGTSQITYSFFAGGTYYGTESSPATVSPAVRENVRSIFNEILEPLFNLTFVEVTDTPTSYGLIRFLASPSASYAYARPPSAGDVNTGGFIDVVGDVVLNPSNDVVGSDFDARNNSFRSGPGSHGFAALIHEIGHALGLKHPFDDTPTLPADQDNNDNTVMTYQFAGDSPATPMPYDILALQYFYGANTSTRATDTTYVFTQVDRFSPGSGMTDSPNPIFTENGSRMKHTLWDGGGVDTVDFGQLPAELSGYRIDIQAGGWITTNAAFNSVSYTGGKVTDFGTRIALSGAVIENVIVSKSSDTISLNAGANRVSGYTPGVAGGTDVIHGSDQMDTLDLSLFTKGGVVESQEGNDLVISLGGSTGSVRIKDYFAAVASQRITILYQGEPTVTILSDLAALRAGQTATITFTISEPVTTFNAGRVTVAGGTLVGFTGSGSVYTATFVPTAGFQGTTAIAVVAGAFADPVGYANTGALLLIPVDTLAPSVVLAATAPLGNTALITFTLSEPIANFGLGSVTVTGGTLTNLQGSGTLFTATFIPASQFHGTATVRILAGGFTDPAGNGNLASNVVSLSVNTLAASIIGFRAKPSTAQLGIGGWVLIEADFSERVTPGGSFVLHLDSGGVVTMVVGPAGLSSHGVYTAQAGDFSADLDVVRIISNSSVQNALGNPLDETLPLPATSLAGRHAIAVDARIKFMAQGNYSTTPSLVSDAKAQFKRIPIRFSTPVYGLTLASLRLSLNGRNLPLAGARLQGSGMSYVLTIRRWGANPVGIFKLSIAPGGGTVKGIGNNAPASDQVSLYWGYRQSIGMVPSAPGGGAIQSYLVSIVAATSSRPASRPSSRR